MAEDQMNTDDNFVDPAPEATAAVLDDDVIDPTEITEDVIMAKLELRAEKRRMNVYDVTMEVPGSSDKAMALGIGTLHLLRDVSDNYKVVIEIGGKE